MSRTSVVRKGELDLEIARMLRIVATFVDRTCGADYEHGAVTCSQTAHQILELIGTQPPPPRTSEPPYETGAPSLARLSADLQLSRCEYDALILSAACELVPRLARVVAHLNETTHTRPTIGLVLRIAETTGALIPAANELCSGNLVRNGLLVVEGDAPLVERELRLLPGMLELLSGMTTTLTMDSRSLDEMVLDDDVRVRAEAWCRSAAPLIIEGARGRGRATLARALGLRLGMPVVTTVLDPQDVVTSVRAARRDANSQRAMLLLRCDAPLTDEAWQRAWSELADLRRPIVLAMTEENAARAILATSAEPALIRLAPATVDERRQLWRAMLPPNHGVASDVIDSLGLQFRFNPSRIAMAIRRTTSNSGTDFSAALLECCREMGRSYMGPLAERLPLPFTREDLVVSKPVREELDLALSWMQKESVVQGQWGFRRKLATGRGLVALFSGLPGTGKTMAAQVIAAELGRDVYRIDLSRVVSKWVGETEKQLAAVFDEAHNAGVILFFDEAEALFGKRSAIKEAQDRYANIEVAYLLQRIETYEGIVVLATNRASDLDPAFFRRIYVHIDFPLPGPGERQRIWQRVFPVEAALTDHASLVPIADRIALSGGEIRNAALAAAYRAAASGDSINTSHLVWAVKREITRSGKVINRQDWLGIDGA